eukprot:3936404-Rhodomonas_salina.2
MVLRMSGSDLGYGATRPALPVHGGVRGGGRIQVTRALSAYGTDMAHVPYLPPLMPALPT